MTITLIVTAVGTILTRMGCIPSPLQASYPTLGITADSIEATSLTAAVFALASVLLVGMIICGTQAISSSACCKSPVPREVDREDLPEVKLDTSFRHR